MRTRKTGKRSLRQLIAIVDDEDQRSASDVAALVEAAGFCTRLFADGDALLAAHMPRPPDCIVLNIRSAGGDPLALLKGLARRDDPPPVIVVSGLDDVRLAVDAMKLGATDFLEIPYRPTALLAAVDRACILAEERRRLGETARRAEARLRALPGRLRQVLLGILRGHPNKVIAHELGLSTRTVESYRAQLLAKLGVRNTAAMIRLALDGGFDLTETVPRPALSGRVARLLSAQSQFGGRA